jgi:hypothetical protein
VFSRVRGASSRERGAGNPPLPLLHPPVTMQRQGSLVSDFYHGTSIEAAMSIQATGFRVDLSGTNAGAMLGNGLYITTDMAKAMHYARRKPAKGAIFKLKVDLGRCYKLEDKDDPLRTTWQSHGYDSCYSRPGVLTTQPAGLEENCLKDPTPPRCVITEVILPHTGEARRLGYEVLPNGKLVDRSRPQARTAELVRTTTDDDDELARVLRDLALHLGVGGGGGGSCPAGHSLTSYTTPHSSFHCDVCSRECHDMLFHSLYRRLPSLRCSTSHLCCCPEQVLKPQARGCKAAAHVTLTCA